MIKLPKKIYSHKWETRGVLFDLWSDYYKINKYKKTPFKKSHISPLFDEFVGKLGLKFLEEKTPGFYTFEIKNEELFFLSKIKHGF